MTFDLEPELLRAAQALCAWRDHVHRDAGTSGFTCADLLGFIEQTNAENAFQRISHRLVAHLAEALAESLAQTGFFERLSAGVYALTDQAFAQLAREPAYLVNEPHQSSRLNELGHGEYAAQARRN